MHKLIKIALTVAYALLTACLLLNYTMAFLPLVSLLLFQVLINRRMATRSKSVETTNVIRQIAYTYKRSKSLLGSIMSLSPKESSVSRDVRRIAKSYFLGSKACRTNDSEHWITRHLKNSVAGSMKSGHSITRDLEMLDESMGKYERMKEQVLLRSSSMSMLTRLGVVFFFPIFSGISLDIINSTLAIGGEPLASPAFTAIIIGYITISIFVNLSLSNIMGQITDTLYQVMPYLSAAVMLFLASSRYLAYAL